MSEFVWMILVMGGLMLHYFNDLHIFWFLMNLDLLDLDTRSKLLNATSNGVPKYLFWYNISNIYKNQQRFKSNQVSIHSAHDTIR